MKYNLFFLLMLSFAFCKSQVYPFPQNVKYPYGLQSEKLTDYHALKAYKKWKNNFVVYCDNDTEARVKNDRNETVSEGIGYGMCIVAYAGDKILFDKLLNYYSKRLNGFGMMNWLYKECETGNNQKNGATDADIDIAFALVVASKQWPKDVKYLNLANDLIDRLQQYNFTECDGLIVQKPGDAFGGCSCTNPSYYAPAYYRVFSELKRKTNQESKAQFWLNAAKDSYIIINKNAHPETGLVYAWTNADGKDPKDCYYEVSGSGTYNSYQYDACRVPWRLANDYLWFGNKKAEAFTQKITNFVTKPIYKQSSPNGAIWYGAGGIENVVDGYWPNGLRRINPEKPSWGHRHTSPFVGSFVLSSMSSNSQQIVDEFMEELSKMKIERYYETCLHVLYTFLASGNYWNPMDMN